jgi:formyl-CoA transferase
MCMKEKFWRRLCERMGRLDLRDMARFRTFADRFAHRTELIEILAREFRGRSTDEWLALLRGAVPCGPVYSVEEALADEQAAARDMVIGFEHPTYGWLRQVGTPIKLAGAAAPVHRRAPRLGEHTDQILADVGYVPAEIAALRAAGVV